MKKLLTLFIIFASFMMQGQNLPAETYRVDRVTFENNTRYKISVEQDPCLELATVLDTEYFQFSRRTGLHTTATSTLRISESSDFSEGISYVIDGSYFGTERPRFNLSNIPYTWGTNRLSSLAVDTARPLVRRYEEDLCSASLENARLENRNANSEMEEYRFVFDQLSSDYTLRIRILDDRSGNQIRSYTHGVGFSSARHTFRVDRAPWGERYRFEFSLEGSGADDTVHTFYGRVSNINSNGDEQHIRFDHIDSRRVIFTVVEPGSVRLDSGRIIRDPRWAGNENSVLDRDLNGHIRSGGVLFGGERRQYEYNGEFSIDDYDRIGVVYTRGDRRERSAYVVNGPQLVVYWTNYGDSQRRFSQNERMLLQWNWEVRLPPGWSQSSMSNVRAKLYSDDGGTFVGDATHNTQSRPDRWSSPNGFRRSGTGYYSLERDNFRDNDWEFKYHFRAFGRDYRLTMTDNINHAGHDSGRPDRSRTIRGGFTTLFSNVVINHEGDPRTPRISWDRNF